MKNLKFLYVLLAVVLIMNIVTFNKVNRLEQRIQTIQYTINNNSNDVRNISSNITNGFNELEKATRWISPVNFEGLSSSEDEIEIKASWQIKDYKKNSKVVFNYKLDGKMESIEATEEGNGSFYAIIRIIGEVEPNWINSVTSHQTEEEVYEQAIKEEKAISEKGITSIEYYVSVETDEEMKASDKGYYSTHTIARSLYGALESNIFFKEEKNSPSIEVDVTLDHNNIYRIEYEIKKVALKVYNRGSLVSTIPLDYINTEYHEDMSRYSIKYENDTEKFDKLELEVVYSNNKKFSREVYQK